MGFARVTRTELPQPDLYRTVAGSTSGSYPGLDRFNRLLADPWRRELTGGDIDLYKVEYAYGDSLGEFLRIVSAQDVLLKTVDTTPKGMFDWAWGYDGLFRLTEGRRGNLSGGAVSNPDLQEERSWGLDHAGNFDTVRWDVDGDGNYTSPGDLDDDRTHNVANELIERDITGNGVATYTLTYDPAGNMKDDGQHYEYVWDAWNRLVAVRDRASETPWAGTEYAYNGLHWRITSVDDSDADGSFNDETVRHYVYSESWQLVAVFHGGDTDPEQVHAHHAAGLGGFGGSSKLDEVILRDRDTTGNGTLDERLYTLQNMRGDVVLVVTDDCVQVERISYMPYGQPFGKPAGDLPGFDGQATQAEADEIAVWTEDGKPWRAYAAVASTGTIDSTDAALVNVGATLGRGVLSHADTANRRGYAGYWRDDAIPELYHVRHRPYHTTFGRFPSRDKAGYIDGANFYAYARGNPIQLLDSFGTFSVSIDEDDAFCGKLSLRLYWYPCACEHALEFLDPPVDCCKAKYPDDPFRCGWCCEQTAERYNTSPGWIGECQTACRGWSVPDPPAPGDPPIEPNPGRAFDPIPNNPIGDPSIRNDEWWRLNWVPDNCVYIGHIGPFHAQLCFLCAPDPGFDPTNPRDPNWPSVFDPSYTWPDPLRVQIFCVELTFE